MKAVTKASEKTKKNIPYLSNIKYGSKESWVMDTFGTTLPRDCPILVYIHGGYWQTLNKEISSYLVEPFFKEGIRVVVPDYDLAPKATLEEMIDQIKSMAKHVLMEAVTTGTRSVWFGGHSAGAHLAASLLDLEWYNKLDVSAQQILNGFVLISGIYDLKPIICTEYNAALNLDSSSAYLLSPINKDLHWAGNKTFFVLIAVAENDSPAFQLQTSRYTKHLKQHNIKTEYIFLEELDHFDIVEKLNESNYLLTKKIIHYMKDCRTEL